MKWLSPLCLLLCAVLPVFSQGSLTTQDGWVYEVLKPGNGQQVTLNNGALTHNQLIDSNGKILVSTYQIEVPDYQLISELSPPFQSACLVMKAGGKYRFHIPVEDFKTATKGGEAMDLPGALITWEVEVLQVLPPKQDVARVISAVYRSEGADAAYQKFEDLRSQRSTQVYFGEWEVNQLGYLFLGQGQTDYAVKILEYNTQAHPNSFNAHDSLGEAYQKAGNIQLAIQHYKRSLQLNPDNKNAQEMLEKLD